MCGISSIYRYTRTTEDDVRRIQAMNDSMRYRGPDDKGVWHDQHFVAGQVRLSIIGVEKGKQPLFNEDQSLVLICNGEIYNYVELKQQLIAHGHSFMSDSDSETILHLYEDYGVECLQYLRGMFAFCLYNTRTQEVFAARDRMGEKTLYYAEIPCGVVFSTELKAILQHYIAQPQLDIQQLVSPIRYTGPIDNEKTYISQIKRLGNGEYMLVNAHGCRRYRYWDRHLLRNDVLDISFDEAKAQTESLLRESVNLCLRSDVPVAVMLSGGIDSSLVAKFAKESGHEVHTITAGYKGSFDCDERSVAKRFAQEQGFIYHEIELDEADFNNCFDEFTQYIDEPITDSAALAQWALYKKVRALGFKVLLGGMGGDEVFYGYPYWNNLGQSYALRRYHESLFPIKRHKQEYIRFLAYWRKILYANHPYEINDKSLCYWMRNDYYRFASDAVCNYDNHSFFLRDVNLNIPFPNVPLGQEIDGIYDFQIDNIMMRAYLYLSDREGMGNSLEIRSPLIDYKLIEFVSSLPMNIKYKQGVPKYFLKEVLRGIIPDYILFAHKRGFTPPTSFVQDVVNNYQYQFFNASYKFYNSVLADRLCSLLLK
jgi:asparagine synthase (glutamine-hydrolysing)